MITCCYVVIADMMTSNGMMVTTTLEPQQTGTTDNTSTSKAGNYDLNNCYFTAGAFKADIGII